MREMKNSNIIWLGSIPSDWNILRVKNTSWLKGRIGWDGLKSEEFTDEGPYLITGTDFSDGKVNWDTCAHITEDRFSEDELLHVKEGDLLITKDGTIGKLAIVEGCPEKVSLNSGVMIIRNNSSWRYDQKFMYYILGSEVFTQWFESEQKPGSTIRHLYQHQFGEFRFPFPSLSEQRSIVSYLDKKCATIDEAIARRRQIIEKLEEYRKIVTTALISGCDSKPVRLKFLLIKGRSGMKVGPFGSDLSTKEYVDEGPWVYTQRTVLDNNYKTNEIHVSEQKYEAMKGFEVLPGDILVTTRGTLGYVSVVPPGAPTGILHPCLIRFRIDSSLVSPTFIKCLFNETDLIMNQIKGKAEGATIGALYSGMLKDLVMPIPSLKDQEIIMQKVQNVHGRIDKQVSINTEIIERLEEYRKSIIYNAITGKIDCREVV